MDLITINKQPVKTQSQDYILFEQHFFFLILWEKKKIS